MTEVSNVRDLKHWSFLAMLVLASTVSAQPGATFSKRALIVSLAAQHRMADISAFREFVQAGGVMSYGAIAAEHLRRQARYAARMAQGTKPWELPIDQPTRFELVVNVKAARALGVALSQVVLLRADEVID